MLFVSLTTQHCCSFVLMSMMMVLLLQDDFFGPEVYTDSSLWSKFMTDKQQLLLSCHLYCCT